MRQWRVRQEIILFKAAGTAVVLALAIFFAASGDRPGLLLAVPAVAGLAVLTLRDVLARVRLAADEQGVTLVSGFSGRRHVPWEEVERIQVDVRRRLGLRAEHLEIDTGASLHLFGPHDLGAPCSEVAAELRALKVTGRR